MNIWFATAAVLSALICGLHVVMGGREAVHPLLAATELSPLTKFTNYYCWHIVTIVIAGMAVAFAYSAQPASAMDLALFATGLAFLFTVWSLGMIARFGLPLLQFGQWLLFLAVGFLGLIGSLQ